MNVDILSEKGDFKAHKIKSEICSFSTIDGNILISSYLESQKSNLKTKNGNI